MGFVNKAHKHELCVEVTVATPRAINAVLEQGKTMDNTRCRAGRAVRSVPTASRISVPVA